MDKLGLDSIFHPRSIAVVGSLRDANRPAAMYLRQLKSFGFPGKLYGVSLGTTAVPEFETYQRVSDIPGPVDYVISCISAKTVLELVDDCIKKGVKVIQLFTARLGETFEASLQQLEREIIRRTQEAGIKVLGPNCMGIYYPKGKLTFRFHYPSESGPVAFISQSAGNVARLISLGTGRGVRFSKAISYGNGAGLNESDFLEYLTDDPETKIIAQYVEGVKDGKRFLATLRRAAATKPVILMKGGFCSAGNRVAASHTASLTGNRVVWDAALKQAGVIRVDTMEEMIDAILAFMFLNVPKGRRVGAMCGGGGDSVVTADLCEDAGLTVPPLPQEVRDEIKKLSPEIYPIIGNPVDYSALGDQPIFTKISEMLATHPQIDLLLGDAEVAWRLDESKGLDRIWVMIDMLLKMREVSGKPLAVIIVLPDSGEVWKWESLVEMQDKCRQVGVPVYPSLKRAVQAITKFVDYHKVPQVAIEEQLPQQIHADKTVVA